MAREYVTVEGADELAEGLAEAARDTEQLTNLHIEIGERLVQESRSIVPVLTGVLAGTLRAEVTDSGVAVRAGEGDSEVYGGVQHFGWPEHNIAPTPYLADAFDRRQSEIETLYEERINELVDEI